MSYGDPLVLVVPADSTDEVGVRDVINDEEVEEVFAGLREKEAHMPADWSRRYKSHVEKLKSGDVYQLAEVVRNLSIREKENHLSVSDGTLTRSRTTRTIPGRRWEFQPLRQNTAASEGER